MKFNQIKINLLSNLQYTLKPPKIILCTPFNVNGCLILKTTILNQMKKKSKEEKNMELKNNKTEQVSEEEKEIEKN